MSLQTASAAPSGVNPRFLAVRSATRSLADGLSAEDQMIQSCTDASPVKWHQAHTTWCFKTFVLRPFLKGYKPFREESRWLFNSYYDSLGDAIAIPLWANTTASSCLARWFCAAGHASLPRIISDRDVSKLFSTRDPLAVHRHTFGNIERAHSHDDLRYRSRLGAPPRRIRAKC